MRKVLLTVAVLAAIASPALALPPIDVTSLPGGVTWTAKYSNYSDLYWSAGTSATETGASSTAGANGAPLLFGNNESTLFSDAIGAYLAGGTTAPGTLENRAIFQATSLKNGTNNITYNPTQQLTGLFYDLTLAGAAPGTLGGQAAIVLDFVPSARSTPLAGLPGVSSLPTGSGGVLQVYVNNSQTFNPDPNNAGTLPLQTGGSLPVATVNGSPQVNYGNSPNTWGPQNWVAGAGLASDTVTGSGTSDGSLYLAAEFVPLVDVGQTPADGDPNTVFQETIALGSGTGFATAWLDFVGGSEYPSILKGAIATTGISVDATLISDEATPGVSGSTDYSSGTLNPNNEYLGTGYWPVDSQDPVTFATTPTIPEPCTLSLLGFGLAGLLIRRRK